MPGWFPAISAMLLLAATVTALLTWHRRRHWQYPALAAILLALAGREVLAAWIGEAAGRALAEHILSLLIAMAAFGLALAMARTRGVEWSTDMAGASDDRATRLQSVPSQSTTDAIWDWDMRTDQLLWNGNLRTLFGYSDEEVTPLLDWWADRVHPDDRERVTQSLHAAVEASDEVWSARYRFRRADGTYAHVYDRGYVLRDESGHQVRMVGAIVDETERVRAEASTARLAAILEATPDLVGTADTEGRVRYLNQAAREFFGIENLDESDLAADTSTHAGVAAERSRDGLTIDRFHPPHVSKHIRNEGIPTAIRDGVWTGESIVVDRHGHEVHVSQAIIAHRSADGSVESLSTIVRNIESIKEVEAKVREQHRNFQTLAANAPDIIARFDRELRHLYVNPVIERITGRPAGEFIGRTNREVGMPEHLVELWARTIKQVFATGEPASMDFEFPSPDGDRSFMSRIAPEFDDEGNVSTVLCISRDVTPWKKSERALRESRERFRMFMDHNPAVAWIKDAAGRYIYVNQTLLDVYQVQEADVIGQTDSDLLPKPVADQLCAHDEKVHRLHEVFEGFETITNPDGTDHTWHVVKFPVPLGKDRIGVGGFALDVTEQHHAEQALRAYARALEQSNQELEQFAYVASHDLQEPLRMVSSYTQLLARRYEGQLDDDADEFIGYAVEGAQRMQQLINDLLAYSRVSSRATAPEPVDLNDVVHEVKTNLESIIRENGATLHHDELPIIHIDRSQCLQLFQNLVNNAVKFRSQQTPEIHISAKWHDNGMWRFTVRDNGIGIDPKYHDRIFVIFQRLHGRGEYPGTGIGLAVCKRVVERYGGRIWVESEPERGAAFHFTLPEKPEPSP